MFLVSRFTPRVGGGTTLFSRICIVACVIVLALALGGIPPFLGISSWTASKAAQRQGGSFGQSSAALDRMRLTYTSIFRCVITAQEGIHPGQIPPRLTSNNSMLAIFLSICVRDRWDLRWEHETLKVHFVDKGRSRPAMGKCGQTDSGSTRRDDDARSKRLCPKVGLDQFGRGQKSQNCRITLAEPAVTAYDIERVSARLTGQQSASWQCCGCACNPQPLRKGPASNRALRHGAVFFIHNLSIAFFVWLLLEAHMIRIRK